MNWRLACEGPQWFVNDRGDVVRGPRSYSTDGWDLLPADKHDHPEHDVGPFRSRKASFAAADQTA